MSWKSPSSPLILFFLEQITHTTTIREKREEKCNTGAKYNGQLGDRSWPGLVMITRMIRWRLRSTWVHLNFEECWGGVAFHIFDAPSLRWERLGCYKQSHLQHEKSSLAWTITQTTKALAIFYIRLFLWYPHYMQGMIHVGNYKLIRTNLG